MSPATLPPHAGQAIAVSGRSELDGALTTAGQNVRDPSGRCTRLACSEIDMLWVMGYTPGEGKEGSTIMVNFTCKADMAAGVLVRLVVGCRGVRTQVREVTPPGCGRWQLEGSAPLFSKQKSRIPTVPLTIQAVDQEEHILDSVTFGDFTYTDADCGESQVQPPSSKHTRSVSASSNPQSSLQGGSVLGADNLERSSKRHKPYSRPPTPASSDSEYGSSQPSQSRRTTSRLPSQCNAQGLRRTRQALEFSEDNTQSAVLDIMTPLDSFCYNWDESELQAGRRLVRFRRMQDRNRLMVSAERISQAEYDVNDIVISCIYRDETDSCCVTSVDIIQLLQRLVDAEFEVDEKNRIRRNLEGLRPTTVSKSRPGFESFFQRIMDFPDPKPRKIEKDLKVFDWKLLPQALDKIVSKYSLYTSPASTPPKEEALPLPVLSFSQGTNRGPSQDDHPEYFTPYEDAPAQPSAGQDPHMEASQLSHLSPVVQLAQFPPETNPDPTPDNHLYSVQEEQLLQPVYVDPELMRRYYQDPDMVYGVPSSLQSQMYTAESSAVLASDTSVHTFSGEQSSSEWGSKPTEEAMLVTGLPAQASTYTPAYDFTQSDSQESIDIYVTPQYTMNTYDSFEFQTLQEHNINAALASQTA
ncbi:hypothetical protein HYDPIDRAFT_166115 [Hydnomerulius pinastri MD-312]|nr:hypothetical protein HYDPIDRAFT_166115 [Hydnomerulius pinastri MD-312]